jgi:hypothetical protein
MIGGSASPSTAHKAVFPRRTVRAIPEKPMDRVHIRPYD